MNHLLSIGIVFILIGGIATVFGIELFIDRQKDKIFEKLKVQVYEEMDDIKPVFLIDHDQGLWGLTTVTSS